MFRKTIISVPYANPAFTLEHDESPVSPCVCRLWACQSSTSLYTMVQPPTRQKGTKQSYCFNFSIKYVFLLNVKCKRNQKVREQKLHRVITNYRQVPSLNPFKSQACSILLLWNLVLSACFVMWLQWVEHRGFNNLYLEESLQKAQWPKTAFFVYTEGQSQENENII